MKILQLCNKIPFPVKDGGTAAMHQLTEYLHRAGHQVKVVAINTHKQHFSEEQLSKEYSETFKPEYVFLDTRIKPHHAFLNLFSSESYNVKRFDSVLLHEKLTEILQKEKFDCVLLDSLFVTPYIATIRKFSKAKIILRSHNIEHNVWERFTANEKNPVKKRYLGLLAKRLKKYESEAMSRVDGIAAISADDVSFVKQHFKTPAEFIPFGYEIKNEVDFSLFKHNAGYFIGAMDWFPNLEAANWIVENLVPALKTELNSFHLTLAGMNMPGEFFNKQAENFSVRGKIENAGVFVRDFGILVAPIFSGGGLKIKVVEAMANGKLVITTKVGAEGLNVEHEKNILIANTAGEFFSALKKCIGNKAYAASIAEKGFQLIKKDFQPKDIIQKLEKFIQKC
jgi:glycosyltransferase involved in cell wall biosynthesis